MIGTYTGQHDGEPAQDGFRWDVGYAAGAARLRITYPCGCCNVDLVMTVADARAVAQALMESAANAEALAAAPMPLRDFAGSA